MSNIANDLRTYRRRETDHQIVPTEDQLWEAGYEDTGDNNGCFAGQSDDGIVFTYIPDKDGQGFLIELLMYGARTYRPRDLEETKALMEELDHQIERYGELQ